MAQSDLIPTENISAVANVNPAMAYLASLRTKVSRAAMKSELNKIARLVAGDESADWQRMNWGTLNAANVAAILAKAQGAPASINKTRAALRGVARAAWRVRQIDSEELARINDVKPVTGSREIAGRQVEGWEMAAVMRTCANDPTPAGARDAALFAVAAKTGARREELTRITLADMTATPDGYEIKVLGKRNKERTLYADDGASRALADWLGVRGDAPGALFCVINKGGRVDPARGMSTTAAHFILQKRAGAAGVKAISWHDLRRTFAGVLLDANEDIATVAQLMGHSSVITTSRYDRRPAEARRKAARKVSVPYFERGL